MPPKAKVGVVEAGGGAGGNTGGGEFGTGAAPLLAPNVNSPPAGGVVPPKAKVGVVAPANAGSIFRNEKTPEKTQVKSSQVKSSQGAALWDVSRESNARWLG